MSHSNSITEITDQVEQIDNVDEVTAYSSDYDFSSPDIIEIKGEDSGTVSKTIQKAVDEHETVLHPQNRTYIIYHSTATITSPNGSKWDVLGSLNGKHEAILTHPGTQETASVGEVFTFKQDDTDYRIEPDG